MKLLVVLSAVFALGAGAPSGVFHAPLHHQYHAQDELGQYRYGYSAGPSAKEEIKTADGVTRGSYSYIDSNNIVQHVQYTADSVNGFRVAATNLPLAPAAPVLAAPVAPVAPIVALPTPVADTPEVVAARAEHLAAKAAAEAKVDTAVEVAPVPAVVSPVPVAETPEVVAEKARHLAAVEVAKVNVASAVDDSHLHDDGSYKINPLEDDGSYRGEPVNIAVVNSAVGPVAAVVSNDNSFLHDDGSYKINPFEDDGLYRGEKVAVVGNNYIHSFAPARTVVAGNLLPGLRHSYGYSAPALDSRYAYAASVVPRVPYTTPVVSPGYIPATHSQYHSQDELGQYAYGYTGGLSAKHESKTADGITRGGYSYIDANGIVQSVNYVSDPVHGFRVAATNLPIAHQ